MNAIQKLQREVTSLLPTALSRLDVPRDPRGEWWIDFKYRDHNVSVQWSPERGFGVTVPSPKDEFGEGAHEIFGEYVQARNRVLKILQTGEVTSPPPEVALRELRSLAGVTQSELAQRLGIKQAAVSRLERRADLTVRSLERFVVALGGELEINVRTPEGHVVRLGGLVESKPSRAHCGHPLPAVAGDNDSLVPQIKPQLDSFVDWIHEISAQFRSTNFVKPQLRFRSQCVLASAQSSTNEIAIDPAATWTSVSKKFFRSAIVENAHARFVRACEFLIAHEAWHLYESSFTDEFRGAIGFANSELRADAFAGWSSAMRAEPNGPLFGAAMAGALGCHELDCRYPPPEERTLAYVRGFSLGESLLETWCSKSKSSSLQLLVLKSRDLERSRKFYSACGLELRTEKHGKGPRHYSSEVNGTVLELYPCPTNDAGSRVRLGLTVPCVSVVLDALAQEKLTRSPARIERAGCSFWIVEDPDGNVLELSEPIHLGARALRKANQCKDDATSQRSPETRVPGSKLSEPNPTCWNSAAAQLGRCC